MHVTPRPPDPHHAPCTCTQHPRPRTPTLRPALVSPSDPVIALELRPRTAFLRIQVLRFPNLTPYLTPYLALAAAYQAVRHVLASHHITARRVRIQQSNVQRSTFTVRSERPTLHGTRGRRTLWLARPSDAAGGTLQTKPKPKLYRTIASSWPATPRARSRTLTFRQTGRTGRVQYSSSGRASSRSYSGRQPTPAQPNLTQSTPRGPAYCTSTQRCVCLTRSSTSTSERLGPGR